LLWGAIFGGFGGWLQLAPESGLGAILPTLQVAARGSKVAARVRATLVGAIVAVSAGALFSLAVCLAGYVYGVTYWSATGPSSLLGSGLTPLATLGRETLLGIFAGPLAAVWLFAVSTGGWFVVFSHGVFQEGTTQRIVIGLIGAPHAPPNRWWYALLALPIIAFTLGGRAAARAWPSSSAGAGLLAGLLTAIPTTLLMAALTYLAEFQQNTYGSIGSRAPLTSLVEGPDVARTVVATLIGAAVFGALGGASAQIAPSLGAVAQFITLPVRPLGGLLFPLFDRLTGRTDRGRSSLSSRWLYDGFALTVVCVVIAIIVGVMTVVIPGPLPYLRWAVIEGALAAAFVAASVFCFSCAFISAVMAPPDWAQPVGASPSVFGNAGWPVVTPVSSTTTP
jgi:hypothetical protein